MSYTTSEMIKAAAFQAGLKAIKADTKQKSPDQKAKASSAEKRK